ncbi:MAG: ferredoxin family protein [Propionibacteriaceae bacterium]|nr:ferredoxin family protein [Propionibacteriaceae bacterium]
MSTITKVTPLKPITVNVDAYLGLNKYEVDEGNPHIELVEHPDARAFGELVRACPAGLYKLDADGSQHVDFAGCLECGTCRIVAGGGIVASWRYPAATMGVEYRYG